MHRKTSSTDIIVIIIIFKEGKYWKASHLQYRPNIAKTDASLMSDIKVNHAEQKEQSKNSREISAKEWLDFNDWLNMWHGKWLMSQW